MNHANAGAPARDIRPSAPARTAVVARLWLAAACLLAACSGQPLLQRAPSDAPASSPVQAPVQPAAQSTPVQVAVQPAAQSTPVQAPSPAPAALLPWERLPLLFSELQQASAALEKLGDDPAAAVREGQTHVRSARGEYVALQPLITPLLDQSLGLARLLGQGAQAEQLSALWSFAGAGLALAGDLLDAADLALQSPAAGGGLASLMPALPAIRDHLSAARASLSQAQAARQRVQAGVQLPGDLSQQVDGLLARWDGVAPGLDGKLALADSWLAIGPGILGQDRPKAYLVLIQTSDELHATGGFITGAVAITLTQGAVTGLGNFEVTKAKYTEQKWDPAVGVTGRWIQPPTPLSRYMGLGNWSLGDANWWADFPATARQAAAFWQAGHGMSVDGVLAVNEQGLQELLRASGPLNVSGETVTDSNLIAVTLAHVFRGRNNAEWAAEQATYTKQLAVALLDAFQRLPSARWPEALTHVAGALGTHDLLLSSFEPAAAALLRETGADGSLKGAADDWLYMVEQNVSYTKASPFIAKQLTYTVTLGADARPRQAQLRVVETNNYRAERRLPGYPVTYYTGQLWNPTTRQLDGWEGYYGGYTRFYVPAGSSDLTGRGFLDPADTGTETGRAVIGGYVGLRPGNQRTLTLAWTPGGQPSSPGRYLLQVQRQPGAPGYDLNLTVALPAGYQAVDVSPVPARIDAAGVHWQAWVSRDISFSFKLAPQTSAVAGPTKSAPAATLTPGPVADPVRIRIPNLGINAVIVPVGLDAAGAMVSPARAEQVAWYSYGARPGEPSNAVLAGHIDWYGKPGAFAQLSSISPGDVVEVEDARGRRYTYVAQQTLVYNAANAPVDKVMGATSEPTLTLITCGGPYDAVRGVYRDRIVVRARLE